MNLLISACLLGVQCKYNGKTNVLPDEVIEKLQSKYMLVQVCPEEMGGLDTPRLPAERIGDKVINSEGGDVTAEYNEGAKYALEIANQFSCNVALMKEKSPSCGKDKIYDGTFAGVLVPGDGVTVELLKKNNIKVYGESEIDELLKD